MEGTVDAMTAAYDALLNAAAAVVRDRASRGALADLKHCLDVFAASCDRAEDLVRTAAGRVAVAAGAGNSPPATPAVASRLEALCRAVQAIVQDLQADGDQEEDTGKEKDPPPPVVQENAAEDK